jgi:phosphoribosylformylglycinamidine synthase
MSDNIAHILKEAMASEHTSYGSTKKYLRLLPTKGKYVLQGPGENAGIVDLGKGYALAMRIESHNHPSFIKPYHGAATGVGGILRDIFTMGARPIATLDLLRFGTNAYAKKLVKEVAHGIADYGNCIGVPTVGGDVYFDATYNNNCLVNVAAFGLLKKTHIIYGNALTDGADLIYVGAKTGNDGIGGAQMASETMNSDNTKAVQEADPYLEKLLLEACVELAETQWIEGMQDMGAAGLLCSTSEVVLRGRKKTRKNLGAKVYLNKVPIKAKYMSPTDMLLSESQERMLIVGKPQYRKEILSVFEKWDLEAHVIGTVTNDGKYTIVYNDQKNKLHTKQMEFDEVFADVSTEWKLVPWKKQGGKHTKASSSVTTPIWQQYDWSVGIRTRKGPNKPDHYAILDIPEIGKEIVIAWSSDEGMSDKSAKRGIEHTFDRCYQTIKKLHATPLGLTNCLNFGHPTVSMGTFVATIEGLAQQCKKYKVPVVSGNVSLYNAYKNHSVKPTPIIVMVGVRKKK